jgi:hypothetical protein
MSIVYENERSGRRLRESDDKLKRFANGMKGKGVKNEFVNCLFMQRAYTRTGVVPVQ